MIFLEKWEIICFRLKFVPNHHNRSKVASLKNPHQSSLSKPGDFDLTEGTHFSKIDQRLTLFPQIASIKNHFLVTCISESAQILNK